VLLPIGHDQATVRRMPWVTLTIMGLCVVFFLLTLAVPVDRHSLVTSERGAVEYAVDHPYLELDPQLKGFVYYSLRQTRGDDPSAPSDSEQVRREQSELDRLEAAYFEARDRAPFWRWGLVPARVELPALVTHAFVHAGWLHLIGNLFILYLVGPALEDAWGRPLFAVFYLLSGVVAALVFVAAHPTLAEPLIGASGAIAGVMGAFAFRFWDTKITFFYLFWCIRLYRGTFRAPAWFMLGLWALGELAFATGLWAFFSVADLGDVGFLAHVGGFVFGVGFAYLVGLLRVEERWIDPAADRRETVHDAALVDEALELARTGRASEAMARLEAELKHNPNDPDAVAALWNIAVASDDLRRAVPLVVPAVAAAARAGDPGLPSQCWAELLRRYPDVLVDVRVAARLAELLDRHGLQGDAEETLTWLAGQVDSTTPEGILVRLARLADRLAVPSPFAALALDRPDLSPELADELQRLSGYSA
jgi:membrane associated rhomboid family serine protease